MWTSFPSWVISAPLYTKYGKKSSKEGEISKIISCEKECGQAVYKSGQGGKKKGLSLEEGEAKNKRERNIHRKGEIVEKFQKDYSQEVEKWKKPCYNRNMSIFCPDFEKYEHYVKERFAKEFISFAELLTEYNKKYNLTSITEEEEITYKHFIDSLAGEKLFLRGENVLEVGSGAGFPSIPLKIVREDLHFTLVESTGKKCEFLKTAVKELGLKNVTVVNARAEELAREENFREQFDVCCARAVARLNTLCEYCIPFIKVGGRMIAYKGEADEEIKEAERAIKLLGGGKREVFRYELPLSYGKRTLVCLQKESETSPKYPRGNGKERRNPLL